ncbi:MAG: ATP-dependent zinc metalloprotease FtsH [Gemmatimonadota bacterium]|nr:MAG: ATP-dependent zinc metalloprotease FtsH [Gemmatimonadota bacterium]
MILILLSIAGVQFFSRARSGEEMITYTEFKKQLEAGNVTKALIIDTELQGDLRSPIIRPQDNREFQKFKVILPFIDSDMIKEWDEKGLEYNFKAKPSNWMGILFGVLPWLLVGVFWIFLLRQMQGGPKGVFTFGKSKAKLLTEDKPKVTFKDVAGADEAKQELQEIIEFLKGPEKFVKLGGKIPKGALLLGPPGTGKTLLAKAVAGEAEVPFFSMSGSDFVEMFVGVGASRVRDLFEQGKRSAPCIIFIDELDAVGRHRGAGLGGGHDEREQTLNQLLVEMDGFESNEGVILLAATNRPDVLDPALLRPGRFDRQIVVDRPDIKGREGILKVHTRKIPLAKNVKLSILARGTPGLSGADLANLVNEAALLAARRERPKVTMIDFEEAKDKVMMGAERKSLVITDEEKKSIAYHESGHALVSKMIPGSDPVHKVTIIPRGRALGLTSYLPIDERRIHSREYCLGLLAHMLGGRAAEKIVLKQLTTGAGNDIEQATELARKMVCDWGMSESLGPITFGKKEEEIFLGREIAKHRDYSERTAVLIDEEVRRLVEGAEKRAENILRNNVDKLHTLSQALLQREILDGDQIDKIIKGEKLSASRPTRRRFPRRRFPSKQSKAKSPLPQRPESNQRERVFPKES